MVNGAARPPSRAHGIRLFVTATGSVAAPRSKAAPETLRANARAVLFDQAAASSSTKRVEEASDASRGRPAGSP